MTDIEIPLEKDRHFRYRFFEALPGLLSWSMLCLPFILSIINVTFAAAFVLAYLLINFARAMAVAVRSLQGFHVIQGHQKLPWSDMLQELDDGKVPDGVERPQWHRNTIARMAQKTKIVEPHEVVQAIIVAMYKESREILMPTIESIISSHYDMKKVILVIAYEERGGQTAEDLANEIVGTYRSKFMHAMAVKHPLHVPNEIIGKGGNISGAGRALQKYLEKEGIDPIRVVVTTLDADNRPDKNYLNALSYVYSVCDDPTRSAFQPVAMYTNNIWDAPAPMRVVATGNSFFNMVLALRPHALRNFSSHAQAMAGLIQTNFWSARSIVEDGHQFWRSYFTFEGNYTVYPLYLPIYQDAVLTDKYVKTLKAQFVQLRRWAWGASDIAYVVDKGFFHKNKVPKADLINKFFRLLEGHVTWATGPFLVLLAGFVPALIHPQSFTANELPLIVSRVQTVALIGVLMAVFLAMKSLPPKPTRYKRHRTLFMIAQWVYLPFTTIAYNSSAALYSQTRLIFGWYIGNFDVTEKAVVTEDNKTVS